MESLIECLPELVSTLAYMAVSYLVIESVAWVRGRLRRRAPLPERGGGRL